MLSLESHLHHPDSPSRKEEAVVPGAGNAKAQASAGNPSAARDMRFWGWLTSDDWWDRIARPIQFWLPGDKPEGSPLESPMELAKGGRLASQLTFSRYPPLLFSSPLHRCWSQKKLQWKSCMLTPSESLLSKEPTIRQCWKFKKRCHSKFKNVNRTISFEAPCLFFLIQNHVCSSQR